jgi:hypothetical protein
VLKSINKFWEEILLALSCGKFFSEILACLCIGHWSHLVAVLRCAEIAGEWLNQAIHRPLTLYFGGGAISFHWSHYALFGRDSMSVLIWISVFYLGYKL